MKYALFDNKKIEATKGANGVCSSCGAVLVAKCGEIKINHWAHKGNRNCDPWWENETDWHRSWKGNFPIEWQEVLQFDESGERHIADVKTPHDWVLEFQHSYLDPEERRSRNHFYKKLIWVVNGLRRKTDVRQFQKVMDESTVIFQNPHIRKVLFPDECRLLKEWNGSNALVLFDFNGPTVVENSMLWFLYPGMSAKEAYLSPFSRKSFISFHDESGFDDFVKNIAFPIRDILSKGGFRKTVQIQPIMPNNNRRYLAGRARRYRRL